MGKVTSLVSRKDVMLANRIEEAVEKNESLESLSIDSIKRDRARSNISKQKDRNEKAIKASSLKHKAKATTTSTKSSEARGKAVVKTKSGRAPSISKGKRKVIEVSKTSKPSGTSKSRGTPSSVKTRQSGSKNSRVAVRSKLNVVGFRGRKSAAHAAG
ncbi:hypothetical protein OROGR_016315 [Orobanche gracilis]